MHQIQVGRGNLEIVAFAGNQEKCSSIAVDYNDVVPHSLLCKDDNNNDLRLASNNYGS